MEPRIITNKDQYDLYMAEIDRLISKDPKADSEDGKLLRTLALLVSDYENQNFTFSKPTAIEAIKFVMEEKGLKQNDLVPMLGSKSKVSEVLSGERGLSLPMIKALHRELDIPLDVLIMDTDKTSVDLPDVASDIPARELVKRGWVNASLDALKHAPEKIIEQFFVHSCKQ